jgi:uncharacterized protein (DUF1330 family)
MSVFFMANINIHDPLEYQNYLNRSEEIFARYRGAYLAVDDKPVVLEGEWNFSRVVLIRFEKKEDFDAWYYSEDYQEILKYRLTASESDTILIHGN